MVVMLIMWGCQSKYVLIVCKRLPPQDNKYVWLRMENSFELRMTSVACAVGPSVTTSSTDFSFQNLVFWNLFEFSAAEIT